MLRFTRTAIVAFAAAIACLVSAAQTTPALAPYAAAFKGDRGIRVTIAHTADDKAALIWVQGVNLQIDKVVFLADKIKNGQGSGFRVTHQDDVATRYLRNQ